MTVREQHYECERRKHVWRNDRCERCSMKRDWPGAKHACEGVETSGELRARVYRTKKRRKMAVAK